MILGACSNESIPIKGFIGDWDSVQPVYHLFKTRNQNYAPSYESKEILYSYPLILTDAKVEHDPRVRALLATDFPQWLELGTAYMKELGLPDGVSVEHKRKDFELKVLDRSWWGLFDGGKLLSRVGLNSKSERIGQVGGVFTPQEFRQLGLAKAVMFHSLCLSAWRLTSRLTSLQPSPAGR